MNEYYGLLACNCTCPHKLNAMITVFKNDLVAVAHFTERSGWAFQMQLVKKDLYS